MGSRWGRPGARAAQGCSPAASGDLAVLLPVMALWEPQEVICLYVQPYRAQRWLQAPKGIHACAGRSWPQNSLVRGETEALQQQQPRPQASAGAFLQVAAPTSKN